MEGLHAHVPHAGARFDRDELGEDPETDDEDVGEET